MAVSLVLEKESLHKKKCHRGICGEEHCQLVSLNQGRWRETRVDYFPMFWDFHRKVVTWKFLVKKLFNGIFFYRSTLSITFTTVETLRLFPLCLWTMLQRVKVGHICTLSNQMLFLFKFKGGTWFILDPWRDRWTVPGKPASLFSDINLMIIVVVLSCTIVCVGRLCGALHWCWEVLFGAGGLDITKNWAGGM